MLLKMKLKENSCQEDWNQDENRIEEIYRKKLTQMEWFGCSGTQSGNIYIKSNWSPYMKIK